MCEGGERIARVCVIGDCVDKYMLKYAIQVLNEFIEMRNVAVSISENALHRRCFDLCVSSVILTGARCSSVVRVFTHGAMGHRIDPSWGGPIELFLVPASAPRLL